MANGAKGAEWINKNYKNLLPVLLEYIYVTDEPEKFVQAIDTIKNYYFGNEDIGPNTDYKIVDVSIWVMLRKSGNFGYPAHFLESRYVTVFLFVQYCEECLLNQATTKASGQPPPPM